MSLWKLGWHLCSTQNGLFLLTGRNELTIGIIRASNSTSCFPNKRLFVARNVSNHISSQTMKAIIAEKPGSASSLTISEYPKPQLQEDYVIVKVRATAVNRADILQRKGAYPPPPGESNILGLEMSGEVEEVGGNATRWKPGDRVCALLGSGGYAEFVKVHKDMLMRIPPNLSFEQAAAIPEVWLTAYQALYWLGNLDKNFTTGRKVLIHAGASGVGTAAIQLVGVNPHNQALVTAGTDEKVQYCKQLGAPHGFNYKQVDFAEKVLEVTNNKGVDNVMDFVGAQYFEKNLKVLALDGIMTMQGFLGGSTVKEANLAPLLAKRLQIVGSTLRSRSLEYKVKLTKDFEEFAMPRFENNTFKPIISQVFTWDKIAEAHTLVEEDKNIGKVILKVQ